MDVATAKDISVNTSVSRFLEYSSYALFPVAAGFVIVGKWPLALIFIGLAIMQYQISQYRLAIEVLQDELSEYP